MDRQYWLSTHSPNEFVSGYQERSLIAIKMGSSFPIRSKRFRTDFHSVAMHRPDSPAYNRADALCCGRLALTFYEKEGLSLHRELRAVWTVTVAAYRQICFVLRYTLCLSHLFCVA
jgi:hypothetical protein